jgi:tripartite-type tricarboxylate transporter receptor subunit TctC
LGVETMKPAMYTSFVTQYRIGLCASALIFGATLSLELGQASAADYPTKAVTIIVSFSPGGSTDAQARLIAKGLAERLGKPVVVENRPGAGGRIGASLAARATPDGHTLFLGTLSTLVIEPVLRTNVDYDPQRDFAPITLITEAPLLLVVSSSLPVGSIADLLAYARKPSVNLTYASWGPGTAGHLLGEMFKASTGIDATHIPYKGGAPALTDLLGGHVTMMFSTPLMSGPHIRSGKVRALAVTGSERLATLPQVPTFAETGLQRLEFQVWLALLAPAKTPEEIIARLRKEIATVVRSSEFTRSVANEGAVVIASSPQDLAKRIQSDALSIQRLVRETNLKVEE